MTWGNTPRIGLSENNQDTKLSVQSDSKCVTPKKTQEGNTLKYEQSLPQSNRVGDLKQQQQIF